MAAIVESRVSDQQLNKDEKTAANNEVATLAAPEPVVKHPLNSRWCLWYFVNDKNLKWEDSQVKVAAYDTVEDFWALINHVESASRLKIGCDYSLFKEHIKPMWEDPSNSSGGKWSLSLNKQQRSSDLDKHWMEMIMMMIGENEEECVNQDICGGVVSLRPRGDRIALWTASKVNPEVTMKVGKSLKSALTIPNEVKLEFSLHTETAHKRGSSVRSSYTI